MTTSVRVLSDEQIAQVHERTLGILERVGVRVDTERGRRILEGAGAVVDEGTRIVRFPRALVEESFRLAPRRFTLGGRRPGWAFPMNDGECTLTADGGAVHVYDAATETRRPGTYEDWLAATRLIDAIDEVGVYWGMVDYGTGGDGPGDAVRYWRLAFTEFSRHVQDAALDVAQARWLPEVLQVLFGDRETIRDLRPFSFLLCPHSPLVIEEQYTDAYLETVGWGIPLAVMPMPLMGLTSPAGLAATIVVGNAEVLATLCLAQAADPGTPFIYAPALAVMDPRNGRYGGGAAEHALLGAAVTEMARSYGLPVEASAGGTDHHVPGIQAAYERALNWSLPALAWPDLLVGPGLLGGATTLSLEQLIIDVEAFRRCRRMREGIAPMSDDVEAIVAAAGPGGAFLDAPSSRDALRAGEWYVSRMGVHDSFDRWEEGGRRGLLEEAREAIATALASRVPLALDEGVDRELRRLEARAGGDAGRSSAGPSGGSAT